MKKLLYIILTLVVLVSVSCRDDFDYLGGQISDETTVVRMALDFSPASEGLTRTTYQGDAIRDIDDLCLVLFSLDGSFHSIVDIDMDLARKEDIARDTLDTSNGRLPAEVTTSRVSVDLDLPLGTYYIHALSNVRKYDANGNVIETTRQYLDKYFDGNTHPLTRAEFCALRRDWDDTSIQSNSELSGFVVNADKNGKSPSPSTPYGTDETGKTKLPGAPVTVQKGLNTLHGWLRRMASKVTVTFDASEMSDNISVYIHDVRLHDIVKSAPLLTYGEAASKDDLIHTDSQVLVYCPDTDLDADISRWNDLKDNWPELTRANWSFHAKDSKDDVYYFPHLAKMNHSNSANSLYFYENMQGDGESKLQDADGPNGRPDGVIDSPNSGFEGEDHYKDNKPCGTYVEVRGYYVNRIKGEESHGPIIYRFMLGKNTTNNYDCERNYHYKLTLKLKGRANEVDWHIDYKSEEDDIYIPNPYYISYGYNSSIDLPIKVKGHITQVTATIIQNNWYPNILWDAERVPEEWADQIKQLPSNYQGNFQSKVVVKDQQISVPKSTALGFLTLFQPQTDAIGYGVIAKTHEQDITQSFLIRYWKGSSTAFSGLPEETRGYPLYTRTFNLKNIDFEEIEDTDKGTWSYTREKINGQEYTQVLVPLYTRERNLAKTLAYTGQNPFIAYQRRAKVRYDIIYIDGFGKEQHVTKVVDIVQVARVANPTAVWRSWNNANPFHVAINLIDGDDNDTFHTLESRGGWSAEVTVGSEWILLNGGRQKIYGANGSKIEFDMKPAGTLNSEKETRFGIIEIRYHDYSCIHRFFVRQGFDPIQLNPGDPYWMSYNMVTKNTVADSPLDEGSMFRYGKWDYPIASSNNYNDKNPWINVRPTDFQDFKDKKFTIVNSDTPYTWDEIGSKKSSVPFMTNNTRSIKNADGTTTKARMMTREDVQKLRDNPNNAFAYGIMYGDGASTTLFNINEVYGYRGYLSHNQYGMRGCLVYNMNTGAQIFFPVGACGYGRRQNSASHDISGYRAVLKYAGAGKYYGYDQTDWGTKRETMKLFYTLFKGYGAIYWFYQTSDQTSAPDRTDTDPGSGALDINYFTFDFNPIQVGNVNNVSNTGQSDACFIRPVIDP